MITLEIAENFKDQVDGPLLIQTAKSTLQHQSQPPDSELTIVITDDERLRSLNLQFRSIDTPTDVLSFPAEWIDPENELPYLGDIAISFPRAEEQAKNSGHATMMELQLLVVHGVLHLLGHDHANPKEKESMWVAQKEILEQLGLDDLRIPNG